jgi:nucleotide-binding universal stress UspA family protein
MSYETIVVHCNDKRRIGRLAGAAVQIAERFDARLLGLSVSPHTPIIPAGMPGTPDVIVYDEAARVYRQGNSAMHAAFFEAAARGKNKDVEWQELDAGTSTVCRMVLALARAADLVVVSQTDSSWSQSQKLDIAEDLILGGGRPVIVVPNSGVCSSIGKRVLVAWDGSREAARATFDALPFLKSAENVTVVHFERSDDPAKLPQSDICKALTRHGVRCAVKQAVCAPPGIGPSLTEIASTLRADLLVMGCYGHTRLREWVFGGASRYQLCHMMIPVLMSH